MYYRVVVFSAPLQGHVLHCRGCCGLVPRLLPHDGYRKAPTTALYSIVNQLDTARRFMLNNYPLFAVLCLVAQSCLTLCDLMDCSPPGSSVRGDSPSKNTGVSFHALLQGIFPTQRLNSGLPHCKQILHHLSHQGSPGILEWVAYPSPEALPDPGIKPGSPALQADSLLLEPPGKAGKHTI